MINLFNAMDLQLSIKDRWGVIDGTITSSGGDHPRMCVLMTLIAAHFRVVDRVSIRHNLLKSRAYYYVDFSIDFAHRDGTDPSATIPGGNAGINGYRQQT
jgi:hypothetical protein